MDILKAELARLGRELPLKEFGQGFRDMGPAIDTLESELLNGKLRHGGNPVLEMCARHAIVVRDAAGNRKLDKSKATSRIDGIVALAMALGVAQVGSQARAEVSDVLFGGALNCSWRLTHLVGAGARRASRAARRHRGAAGRAARACYCKSDADCAIVARHRCRCDAGRDMDHTQTAHARCRNA